MFTMGITLAVILATFEIYCHRSFPRLGKFIQKSAMSSMIFSMTLAVGLGVIFPASGVVALMGAVGATVLVQPYYFAIRNIPKAKQLVRRAA